jgi:hypothetical protein
MKIIITSLWGNKLAKIALVIFAVLTIWWLYLQGLDIEASGNSRQFWAAIYQVLALYGAIIGIVTSKYWGGVKSVIGRAILAFSVGLLLQSFGQSVYSYYIYFAQIEVPYPSLGDVGFFGSIFAYIYGAILLARASGVKVSLKSFDSQVTAIAIPLGLLIFSYIVFLGGYEFDLTSPLTIFLDFGYPLGQAIYVSIAILVFLLSRQFLGGMMKGPVLFLIFALVIQYFSDYTFLYQANRGSWIVGGINDFLYAVSYLLMALALIYVSITFEKIRQN